MVRQILKRTIRKSLAKLQKQNILPDFAISEIKIEQPTEKIHGDYATNIAMVIAKEVKKNPIEIAKLIIFNFQTTPNLFEKIEIAEPGFINFFLAKEFLQNQVVEILKENFGKLDIGKNLPTKTGRVRKRKKVNIEFISANPTGPLHIGNGRGAFFGNTLANILEKAGYEVQREYFINDAKTNTQIKLLGETGVGKGITYLNDYLKRKIRNSKFEIQNYKLKFKEKEKLYGEVGHFLAKEIQKDIKNFIEKKLKIKFDKWFSEQKEIFDSGKIKKTLKWLKDKKLTYEKEGAVWLKTSEFGDEKDWIIVRSDGEPSYFLSDIVYHKNKIERRPDKIINIWGADHQGHIQKMKSAIKILGYKGKFDILISQMVRLKTGRMSKRKGEIVKLEDLIDEVGLDVARFFYLTKSLDTQMEFDLDLAKEQSEKNPVFYIQYAHARICSILRKATSDKRQVTSDKRQVTSDKQQVISLKSLLSCHWSLLAHPSELELIKQLIRLPEIVEDIAKDYQVQRLPQYALDLATSFHQFYRDCRILGENKNLERVRLFLILATKIVLKNILNLMGISAPEKM